MNPCISTLFAAVSTSNRVGALPSCEQGELRPRLSKAGVSICGPSTSSGTSADTYFDRDHSEPSGMQIEPEPVYVVTALASDVLGTSAGDAGPCFAVSADDVDLVGRYDDLHRTAETTEDTRLWSGSDDSAGSTIRDLPTGKILAVQFGEDTSGNGPPYSSTFGVWLHVKVSGYELPRHGWVRLEHVRYR